MEVFFTGFERPRLVLTPDRPKISQGGISFWRRQFLVPGQFTSTTKAAFRMSEDTQIPSASFPAGRYSWGVAIAAATTVIAWAMYGHLNLTSLAMIYLLGASLAGAKLGRGPAVLTSVLGVLAFNFCFVEPRFTFAVAHIEFGLTLFVMLAISLTIGSLAANVRQQTWQAAARERRTRLLYEMASELVRLQDRDSIGTVVAKHVGEGIAGCAALLTPDADGRLTPRASPTEQSMSDWCDSNVAQWVMNHASRAGWGTEHLSHLPATYLPLAVPGRLLGVLAVKPHDPDRVLELEQEQLLAAFANQIAQAMERTRLAEETHAARVTAETEALRNTLLASISHDLRAPLAVITGASTALADPSLSFNTEARASLARTIASRARDMSELISNVLDLMRFESGQVPLRRRWETLDDLVGLALSRVETRLGRRGVAVELPEDLPAIYVDAVLFTQVLTNLLENAAKHTPDGTRIQVTARSENQQILIVVEDDGPGLPAGDPNRLFAKFQRGRSEGDIPGAGLGLAICRAVVEEHGGRISASSRDGGGTRVTIRLPAVNQQHD